MNILNKNTKFVTVLVISIALTLIFIEQISQLLLGIGNNINYNNLSFQIGYYLIAIFLICYYVILISKNYIQNKKITFLIVYTTLTYLFLRLSTIENLYFKSINEWIKYADIIIFIAILHFSNLISVQNKNNSIKSGEQKSFFLEDSLYVDNEIDNEQILQKLISSISNYKPEVAFSIGLNAIWGYGKSSFLNRFKNEYQKTNPNEIIFWNRIWKNKGSIAIVENFFEELKDNLKPYSGEIAEDINKYVESILSLSSTDLHKIITTGTNALSENSTLEKYFSDINDNIRKIDRQIIILLDDLDRLEKTEILNTLKLIRTLSDFNNVIFIAGYDRKYIVETIEMPKDNYLDKIFNVEINLLPFDEENIVNELLKQVGLAFPAIVKESDSLGFKNGFKNIFVNKPTDLADINTANFLNETIFTCTNHTLKYQDFLKTYRDVKRFVNEFKFNSSFLDNENDVIAEEYILLKLLTYKYRDLENDVFAKIRTLFKQGTIDNANNTIQQFGGSSINNVYLYDEEVQKKINDIISNYKSEDIEIINAVLCTLFREKSIEFYQQNQNSISKIYYADIYLRNNIVAGKISITQLQSAYDKSELFKITKDLSKSIINHQYQVTNELKQFIFNNGFNTIDQFKDGIKTLNFILPHTTYNDDQKVIDLLSEAFHRLYNENKSTFLEDLQKLLNNNPLGYFNSLLSSINLNLKRKESKSQYNNDQIKVYSNNELNTQDLKKIFIEKLKNSISTNDTPENVYAIYRSHIELIAADKKIIHSREANEIIKNDIKLRFAEYLKSPVFKSLTEKIDSTTGEFVGYAPHAFLSQIFSKHETIDLLLNDPNNFELFEKLEKEGWKNFNSLIREINLSDEYYDKLDKEKFEIMKKFIKAFGTNDYKPLNKNEYDKIWEIGLPF
jgi:hypothetical protein